MSEAPTATPPEPKSEKLIIENFLCIDKAELDVKPITILVGPQASGKSVVARVHYFLKSLGPLILENLDDPNGLAKARSEWLQGFDELFKSIGSKNYSLSIPHLVTLRASAEIETEFGDQLLEARRLAWDAIQEQRGSTNPADVQHALWKAHAILEFKLGRSFPNRAAYIPAGRAFFSAIDANIYRLKASRISAGPLLDSFGSYLELARIAWTDHGGFSGEQLGYLDRASEQLLGGRIKLTEELRGYISGDQPYATPLAYASSGQQELFSLLIILRNFIFDPADVDLYIEEPEAHLHPDAQKRMLELLIYVHNATQGRVKLFITTHSPYVLTALNTLLEAGKVAKENLPERLVPLAITPGSVACYHLDHGTCHDIVDHELDLISASTIDSASSDILREFEQVSRLAG